MKKYKVGYTTGVFDLFHIGHLNLLRNAKALCEHLIVGVSTDEVVMSYKHKMPVIPYEERAAIVEAIKYVDQVVPQTSMDKREAWKVLHYDALFHGDDWKGSPMYDKYIKEFEGTGVDMVFLPHTDGTSSTMLASAINEALKND
ncbi:MAG: adenylyltransferase/cytidyltransferase family protein [Faecousia sp.]